MSRFIVVTEQGYSVAWAPTFSTYTEAEAWVNHIGEGGGWEGQIFIEEQEGEDA